MCNLVVCVFLSECVYVLKQLAGKMVFRRREGTGRGLKTNGVYVCVLTRVRERGCVLVFV